MNDIDLSALSLKELKSLQNNIAEAITGFEEKRRKEAIIVLEAKARELGFTLNELTGKKKSVRPSAPAKYRHPENASLTWSGRGRQPAWFKEAVGAGTSPNDLLIS